MLLDLVYEDVLATGTVLVETLLLFTAAVTPATPVATALVIFAAIAAFLARRSARRANS